MKDKWDCVEHDIEKQIEILKRILSATEEEIHDISFLTDNIKAYGIYPFAWIKETCPDGYYTLNGMMQVPGEFAAFCKNLLDISIKTAIEVGVYRGRSSYFMCAILYRNNPDLIYELVDVADCLDDFERFKEVLPCLKKSIPHTSKDYKNKSYDFVFIDADHGYTWSCEDYIHLGENAKKLVCFHDIYAHEYDSQEGGIVRTWEEVCAATPYDTKLMFSQFPNRWMGIGMIIKNSKASGEKEKLSFEEIQKEANGFLQQCEGKTNLWIYGTRNDSRRMKAALERAGYLVQGYVVATSEELTEDLGKDRILILEEETLSEAATVVLCLRESLQEEYVQKLLAKGILKGQIIRTTDRTATFLR